ncbi:MAG: TenA family transcriptional regulator [Chloroflexota bacterium]
MSGKTGVSARRMSQVYSSGGSEAGGQTTASLSAYLWNNSQDLAQEALATKYIQGIKSGLLDPNAYGQYSVQDVVYCHNGVTDWQAVASRATRSEVQEFANARVLSWQKYAAETYGDWHISDPSAVTLSTAAQTYADFESKVAHTYDPLYAVVVMIPCDRLWYWLATQLKGEAATPNTYQFWIDGNSAGDNGAAKMEAVVDSHATDIDQAQALTVYRTAMLGEVNFFRSACGQKLLEATS